MDWRTPADRGRLAAALARIPDEPRWVDTRGMLLSGRAEIASAADEIDRAEGFLVVVADVSLAAVVGSPPADVVRGAIESLGGDVNVLAQKEDEAHLAAALPGWTRRTAVLHVLPGAMPWEAEEQEGARVFTRETAPSLDHLPQDLRREVRDALQGRTTARYVAGALPMHVTGATDSRIPVAAAWADRRPVAFCYPVWQTESWWDVSIDTLAAYRQRGFGARAARTLIRYMRTTGKAPVWGALDTNLPSRTLAARLGFIETAGITVFTVV